MPKVDRQLRCLKNKRLFILCMVHYIILQMATETSGWVFHKRKLDSVTGKDVLYRKVLHEVLPYMV